MTEGGRTRGPKLIFFLFGNISFSFRDVSSFLEKIVVTDFCFNYFCLREATFVFQGKKGAITWGQQFGRTLNIIEQARESKAGCSFSLGATRSESNGTCQIFLEIKPEIF